MMLLDDSIVHGYESSNFELFVGRLFGAFEGCFGCVQVRVFENGLEFLTKLSIIPEPLRSW